MDCKVTSYIGQKNKKDEAFFDFFNFAYFILFFRNSHTQYLLINNTTLYMSLYVYA